MSKVKTALAKLRADCTANGVNLVLGFGCVAQPKCSYLIVAQSVAPMALVCSGSMLGA